MKKYIFSADWYKDRLTDAELEELEFPKTTPKPSKSPGASRRRPSRPRKQQKPEEE
jgi:hypothetical protein